MKIPPSSNPEILSQFNKGEMPNAKTVAEEAIKEENIYNVTGGDGRGGPIAARHFERRANRLKRAKWITAIFLIIPLFIIILTLPIWHKCIFQYILYANDTLPSLINSNDLKWEYFSQKIFFAIFLTSIFAWLARIFNQTRRLEATYLDKSIIAETYPHFFAKEKENPVLQEYALETLFTPSLTQAEQCYQKTKDDVQPSIVNAIDTIGKLTQNK